MVKWLLDPKALAALLAITALLMELAHQKMLDVGADAIIWHHLAVYFGCIAALQLAVTRLDASNPS